MTFAALFVVAGAGLLALNYALLQHSLRASQVPMAVPSYPASAIISRDKALISNPQASALDKAAAQGQLALAERDPHARLAGALLPQIGTQSAIQAAQARTFDAVLSQLIRQSALVLAPLAVLAVTSGWLVARRMLGPVRRLTTAARQLSAANLHQRLHLTGPRDELKELGDTFDQMLARLEAAFQSQRHFIANASHELRTPLAIMRTELDVTLDKGQASPASCATWVRSSGRPSPGPNGSSTGCSPSPKASAASSTRSRSTWPTWPCPRSGLSPAMPARPASD